MSALVASPRRAARGLVPALALAGAASLVAVAAQRDPAAGLALALLPALALLGTRPVLLSGMGIALLPLTADLLPGLPLKVSLSDAALALAVLTALAAASRHEWAALKPSVPWVAAYAVALLPSLAVHHEPEALLGALQRLQIVAVPLVVGAVVLRRQGLRSALTAYVVVSAAVGVLFGLDLLPASFELQKNPVGQFVAGAVLVALDGPTRLRLLALPPLAFGLFQTESRGAVLGLLLGFAVLVLTRPGASRVRTAALLLPVLVLLGLSYAALPDDVQRRTTTFVVDDEQPDAASGAQYTIRIREAYREDALDLVRANPVSGVGVGQYRSGNLSEGTLTDDPHMVLLLEAAEGGVPLLVGLTVLLAASSAAVWRRRRDTPLAGIALAVQASTVAHALVDVYWVRGTPVLGWLLVGAALADAARRSRA